MKLRNILPIGALLLCAAAARPQEAGVATTPAPTGNVIDVSSQEMPAVRQAVQDEALHRDRLGRIHRLRELYAESGDRARLAQLDDLERRELQMHDARRVRARANLSDDSWTRTRDFMSRGGVLRTRVAKHQAERERAAQHKSQRERSAQASKPSRPSRPAAPSRPAPRGGRSPR